MREVADVRLHGTTGEKPLDRFLRAEATALKPLGGRARFQQKRELRRRVHTDLCIEVDTNYYSVPWRLIGEEVLVTVSPTELTISHAGEVVATHPRLEGTRQRSVLSAHFSGLKPYSLSEPTELPPSSELLRPLAEYESAAGGAW